MTTPLQLPTLQSTRGRTGSSTSTTSGKTLRPAKYAPNPSTAALNSCNSTLLMMYSLILMYRGILPDPDVSVVGAGSNRRDAAGNRGNV